MSRSDEPPHPSAPFAGDGSGKIFDAPDMVWSPSAAAEQVVDTQSGFMVVIRQAEGKQSLLVKRRLGTPPSSTVTLTPDESVQLAKILLGRTAGELGEPVFTPEAEALLARFPQPATGDDITSSSYNRIRARAAKRRARDIALLSSVTVLLFCALIGYCIDAIKSSALTLLHP